MKTLPIVLLCAALAGCYTTSLHGDATLDPGPDTVDVATDSTTDPAPDPADAYDVPADILPDGSECPPPDEGGWLTWSLDGEEYDDGRTIDMPCTILSVDHSETALTRIEMLCGTGGVMEHHMFELFTNRHPRLDHLTGVEVMLNYVSTSWEWQDRWFSLHHFDGELIMAVTSATSLAPPDRTVDEWYWPLSVRFATGLCPLQDGECGMFERAALDVEHEDDRALVFDSGSTIMGGGTAAQVTVETAWNYETMECFDFPFVYMNALFVMLFEG